jgi:hypothetical protein
MDLIYTHTLYYINLYEEINKFEDREIIKLKKEGQNRERDLCWVHVLILHSAKPVPIDLHPYSCLSPANPNSQIDPIRQPRAPPDLTPARTHRRPCPLPSPLNSGPVRSLPLASLASSLSPAYPPLGQV